MGVIHPIPANSWFPSCDIASQAISISYKATRTARWLGAKEIEGFAGKGLHSACIERASIIFITYCRGIIVQILDRSVRVVFME